MEWISTSVLYLKGALGCFQWACMYIKVGPGDRWYELSLWTRYMHTLYWCHTWHHTWQTEFEIDFYLEAKSVNQTLHTSNKSQPARLMPLCWWRWRFQREWALIHRHFWSSDARLLKLSSVRKNELQKQFFCFHLTKFVNLSMFVTFYTNVPDSNIVSNITINQPALSLARNFYDALIDLRCAPRSSGCKLQYELYCAAHDQKSKINRSPIFVFEFNP